MLAQITRKSGLVLARCRPSAAAASALRFASTDETPREQPTAGRPPKFRQKKTFQFSDKDGGRAETALETFEYPAYWDVDYPEGFDDEMKHEVEKLQIFADFTPYLDLSWQKQIHPLFDGEAIKMTLNCPLEDFDERLFVDDKNTYDTKVIMEVPLTCFVGLNKEAKQIVAQLAGPRYNANKKQLKITEDRYPTRVFNHKRICDILRELTETALKLSGQTETELPATATKVEKVEEVEDAAPKKTKAAKKQSKKAEKETAE